jgi:type IV pilus assembly protein PilE
MQGMTLIELLVVVVIIGILISFAYSGYQAQVQATRRSDGKTTLTTAAQQLERCFTRFHSYTNGGCAIATAIGGGLPSNDGWYVITDDNSSATTFRLVATPQGTQTNDTLCANLRLTHTGLEDATGTDPGRCW